MEKGTLNVFRCGEIKLTLHIWVLMKIKWVCRQRAGEPFSKHSRIPEALIRINVAGRMKREAYIRVHVWACLQDDSDAIHHAEY